MIRREQTNFSTLSLSRETSGKILRVTQEFLAGTTTSYHANITTILFKIAAIEKRFH
jgi:hypothetical protein